MNINIEDIIILQDAAEARFGDGTRVVFAADHAAIETDDFSYDDHWTDTHARLDFSVFAAVASSGLVECLAAIAAAAPSALDGADHVVSMRYSELTYVVRRTQSVWERAGKPVAGPARDAVRTARSAARFHSRDNAEALARFRAYESAVKRSKDDVRRLRGELQRLLDALIAAHRVPAEVSA